VQFSGLRRPHGQVKSPDSTSRARWRRCVVADDGFEVLAHDLDVKTRDHVRRHRAFQMVFVQHVLADLADHAQSFEIFRAAATGLARHWFALLVV
jgi:hypothetical protein